MNTQGKQTRFHPFIAAISTWAIAALILFGGAVTARAWVYYGNATLVAKSGATVLASGTANNMRAGYFPFAGRHYSVADFQFKDRAPGNNRKVYAETLAYHEFLYYQQMPGGGKLPKIGTSYATSGYSARTSGSWSGAVQSTWKPTSYTAVGSIFRICEDIRWAPDKCGTTSKYTRASNYK